MDIVDRLKYFMNLNGIAISQFADTCQIPRPTMSQILNGRNKKISDELIGKIHSAYPTLSIMWLMFGEGDINNSAQDIAAESSIPVSDPILTGDGVTKDSVNRHSIPEPDYFTSAEIGHSKGTQDANSLINFEFQHSPSDQAPKTNRAVDQANISKKTIGNPPLNDNENPVDGNLQLSDVNIRTSGNKKITNIVVFYSDNSFQSFYPDGIK